MSTLLDLVGNHIFGGVPSNAIYDLLKAGWQKASERTLEELYLEAFENALEEERPRLARHADGEITLERADLRAVLNCDLGVTVSSMPLSGLTDQDFAASLAKALTERQALIISGHTLSEEDYAQLVYRLVQHATALFKAAATQNAFQQAVIGQTLYDHVLLQQTNTYLEQRFDLVLQTLSLLPDIKADTEAIKRAVESIPYAFTASTAPRQTRSERLREMAQLSRARCIERWQAAGLLRDEAAALADDVSVGAPKPDYLPHQERPLVVLVAELGAGKSLIGERIFQSAVELARTKVNAPVPIYLAAREFSGKLEKLVLEQAKGIGDVRRHGATIIIDGADGAGGGAEGFLSECRILVNLWPHTTAVITSRPLPAFSRDVCRQERVDVELLSDEEATALIKRLSGNQHFFLSSWPKSVRDAVRRPLFAVLLSVYIQNPRDDAPQSTGELLSYLVERAIGRVNADRHSSHLLLQRLAVLSTDRAGAYVPTNEVASRDQIQSLLDSRLVVERGQTIGFPLAILTEWFAAHSLGSGYPDPLDLISDLKRIEFWRYPLVMFLSIFGYAQVSNVLEKLAEQHPAFASVVLSEASAKWNDGGQAGSLSAGEWGLRIRTAMQAWAHGIGPLAELIAPVSKTGRLRSLGTDSHNGILYLAWYHGAEDLPDVVNFLPATQESHPFDWPVGSVSPGQRPTWAWRWTHDQLKYNLKELLRTRSLPMTDGPLAREYFWRVSLAMAGHGSLWDDPIPVSQIEETLGRMGENEIVTVRSAIILRPDDIAWYKTQIANLRSSGVNAIEPPWPGPDLVDTPRRWIWDSYSDERLLARTTALVGAAIEGYGQLVETWFQPFASRLATAVVLPARFVGVLFPPPREDTGRWKGPSLHCYWLPLEHGESIIVDIQLGTTLADSSELFETIRNHIGRFRPQAASWLPMSIQHGSSDLFTMPNPVTALVYKWISDDLRRVSWID